MHESFLRSFDLSRFLLRIASQLSDLKHGRHVTILNAIGHVQF